MTITKGTKTRPNCFSFHLSASYHGYLKGLELMQVPKAIKEEYGGGMKEFTLSEVSLTCQNHSLPFFDSTKLCVKKMQKALKFYRK